MSFLRCQLALHRSVLAGQGRQTGGLGGGRADMEGQGGYNDGRFSGRVVLGADEEALEEDEEMTL